MSNQLNIRLLASAAGDAISIYVVSQDNKPIDTDQFIEAVTEYIFLLADSAKEANSPDSLN